MDASGSAGSSQLCEYDVTGNETAPNSATSRNDCIVPFPRTIDFVLTPARNELHSLDIGGDLMIALTKCQMQSLVGTCHDPIRKAV